MISLIVTHEMVELYIKFVKILPNMYMYIFYRKIVIFV